MPSFTYHRGDRFHVTVDILLMLLFASQFFDLLPMAWLFQDEGRFFSYILLLIVIYIRNMGFSVRYEAAAKMKPVWWIVIGVLISFIPAYRYYGQHLYHSVIVYRQFFGYFAMFVLLSVKPTVREIKRAFYAYSFLFLFFTLFVTFVNPSLVPVDDMVSFVDESDFVHKIRGVEYVLIAFIFSLDDFRNSKRFSRYYLAFSAIIFVILFLPQNRTTLLASMFIILLAVFANRSVKRRLTAEVLLAFFGIILLVLAGTYIWGLVEETIEQLGNEDYNRVKAFNYFTSAPNGFMSLLWGNGFISGNVHPIVSELQKEGIFYSDMGLLGFWYQFGVIPVLTILVYTIRGFSRKHSFLVRANALFILVSALTLSYFLIFQYSLWLCLFFYLNANDRQYEEAIELENRKIKKRLLKRYRSLA